MASAIGIMTRSPSDPRIKARLIPRIHSETSRCELALAFLDDLIDRCRALPDVLVRVAITPPVEGLRLHRPQLTPDMLLPQRGSSLAERQLHAFEDLAAKGFADVVLIGSDVPDLPAAHLEQAMALVGEAASNVVLGPADDGGCYLCGLQVSPGAVPDVFSAVRWESPHAQDDLMQTCERSGRKVKWLPAWNDVDAPADLNQLIDRLRYTPESAPHTSAVLRRIGLL